MVALRKDRLTPETADGFRRAVSAAAKLIESKPDHFRAFMVEKRLLPAPVAANYRMVRFSMFGTADGLPPLPTPDELQRVGEWMKAKGMIENVPAYDTVVAP